jgi:hypothetical protein
LKLAVLTNTHSEPAGKTLQQQHFQALEASQDEEHFACLAAQLLST